MEKNYKNKYDNEIRGIYSKVVEGPSASLAPSSRPGSPAPAPVNPGARTPSGFEFIN